MEKLLPLDIARMMDLSVVRTDVSHAELLDMIDTARRYRCVCVFPMPCYAAEAVERLREEPDIGVGGVVGFPSGATTTESKTAEAEQLVALGCDELDMVMNVGWMLSGREADVLADIRAVRRAADAVPLKVIFECHYLNDAQIRRAAELCLEADVAWVKTGTGWAPTGATPENIALMKSVVGDRLGVKAAGGVRDLAALLEMYRRGARRFGIGLTRCKEILQEAFSRPEGWEVG